MPTAFILEANDWVPNNSRLPVLHYRRALQVGTAKDTAAALEAQFRRNGWPPQWRYNTVFDYHHYHTTSHEVLGVAAGSARLMLGGPGGREVTVEAGDVVVLPVGIGHRRLHTSSDFLLVGAYPPGQNSGFSTTAPTAEMVERMKRVPFPASDPVTGPGGPLVQLWK